MTKLGRRRARALSGRLASSVWLSIDSSRCERVAAGRWCIAADSWRVAADCWRIAAGSWRAAVTLSRSRSGSSAGLWRCSGDGFGRRAVVCRRVSSRRAGSSSSWLRPASLARLSGSSSHARPPPAAAAACDAPARCAAAPTAAAAARAAADADSP